MALGTVPVFQGLPVFNPVLRNAFGWTAGQMSWAFAVTRFEGGLLGPVEGLLIEKLGPRRMVFIGLTILGSGFVLFSRTQELWHLYAAFFIMSLGAALGSWLPMMTLMNSWFIRHRSSAMARVMEGFALGGIIFPPLAGLGNRGSGPKHFGALWLEGLCPLHWHPTNSDCFPSIPANTQSPGGPGLIA